jgi:hypothetical protein
MLEQRHDPGRQPTDVGVLIVGILVDEAAELGDRARLVTCRTLRPGPHGSSTTGLASAAGLRDHEREQRDECSGCRDSCRPPGDGRSASRGRPSTSLNDRPRRTRRWFELGKRAECVAGPPRSLDLCRAVVAFGEVSFDAGSLWLFKRAVEEGRQ